VRKGKKVEKRRVYLGANLEKHALFERELEADKKLLFLNSMLDKEDLGFLDEIKSRYLKEPKQSLENRYEAFCSLFTYDSAAIEGNTFTLRQTSSLLFDKIVPSSKSLREVNEILNHKKAFDYILNYRGDITKKFILELHGLIVNDTLRPELANQIGKYRTVQVYIRGADWTPPKPGDVPKEMKTLLLWYSRNKKSLHPLVTAAYFHARFEIIHPFVDGNGRVGRLLMNFILHKNKYPMINIPNRIRHKYYNALHEAQVNGNLIPFVRLLTSILKESSILF